MAEDTSNRSYCAPFFCKNKIFEPKGFSFSKKKKKFYDKIMFIYPRMCIHMYTSIHTCIITLFLLAIRALISHFSWQRIPPAIATMFPFFFEGKKIGCSHTYSHAHICMYTYIHTYMYVHSYVYIYIYIQERTAIFYFLFFLKKENLVPFKNMHDYGKDHTVQAW